ncbi:MAG: hypothetical protein ACFFG0_40865 [Candidatus Thorarchaeota archaeon]
MPKKPKHGNILEACRKDFRNFKKDEGNKIYELLDEKILQFTELGMDLALINNQKLNMEKIRKLIKEGKEDIAFSLFFKTYPTCLPYRTRF